MLTMPTKQENNSAEKRRSITLKATLQGGGITIPLQQLMRFAQQNPGGKKQRPEKGRGAGGNG